MFQAEIRHKPLRILLVEDNDDHAYIIARHLSGGHNKSELFLTRADRVKTAIEKLRTHRYDVILLDLRLPDSGIDQTLPTMLSQSAAIPIVVLSAVEDLNVAIRAVQEGAQDYICKADLSPDLLLRSIYSAIERKHIEIRLRDEIVRNKTLFEFSHYAIKENYPEFLIDKVRALILQNMPIARVEYFRRDRIDKENLNELDIWSQKAPFEADFSVVRKILPTSSKYKEKVDGKVMVATLSGDAGEEPHGFLVLLSKMGTEITSDEIEFLQALINSLSVALTRVRLQRKLQDRISELRTAHRKKDDFLAALSHDLRTPLTVIKGALELIRVAEPVSDDYKNALNSIERNLVHEVQLVADTLEISRIATGKMHLVLQPVLIKSIIEEAKELVEIAARAKGVELFVNVAEELIPFLGDPDRLRQVFWNLFSNAVKLTPSGGSIHVEGGRVGSLLEINFWDTGLGIEPASLPHIFDKFWQGDPILNSNGMGLGIGLSIVKHIVELHGGQVSVQSEGRNRGTHFTISIPMKMVPAEVPSLRDGSWKVKKESVSQDLLRIKVVIVDDSEDNLVLLRRLLERRGADVVAFSSSVLALGYLKTQACDILVSDIGMPDMDGNELIRSLRQWEVGKGDTLPAIALSAYTRDEDKRKAMDSGFQIHMNKPSSVDDISRNILKLMGRKHQEILISEGPQTEHLKAVAKNGPFAT